MVAKVQKISDFTCFMRKNIYLCILITINNSINNA